MIGLRVTCAADGCERHFDVDALAEGLRIEVYEKVVDICGVVAAPASWATRDGELFCSDHATITGTGTVR